MARDIKKTNKQTREHSFSIMEVGRSSVLDCLFMVWWVIGSIPPRGHIQLFARSTTGATKAVLSCL